MCPVKTLRIFSAIFFSYVATVCASDVDLFASYSSQPSQFQAPIIRYMIPSELWQILKQQPSDSTNFFGNRMFQLNNGSDTLPTNTPSAQDCQIRVNDSDVDDLFEKLKNYPHCVLLISGTYLITRTIVLNTLLKGLKTSESQDATFVHYPMKQVESGHEKPFELLAPDTSVAAEVTTPGAVLVRNVKVAEDFLILLRNGQLDNVGLELRTTEIHPTGCLMTGIQQLKTKQLKELKIMVSWLTEQIINLCSVSHYQDEKPVEPALPGERSLPSRTILDELKPTEPRQSPPKKEQASSSKRPARPKAAVTRPKRPGPPPSSATSSRGATATGSSAGQDGDDERRRKEKEAKEVKIKAEVKVLKHALNRYSQYEMPRRGSANYDASWAQKEQMGVDFSTAWQTSSFEARSRFASSQRPGSDYSSLKSKYSLTLR